MSIRLLCNFVAVLLLVLAASQAQAQGWGTFSGKITYDGKAPVQPKLEITKDIDFCGKFPLVDESLIVGENGGIKNVIVGLYLSRGDAPPPIHPDYEAAAKEPVVFNNDKCRFDPRVATVMAGQTLQIGNLDTVGHNTKIDTFTNSPINPIIPAGGKLNHVFSEPERLPAKVSCSIHPWMTSWLVIRDNPYVAVTGAEGKFEIKNVPAGEWKFQLWQESAGYVSTVSIDGKEEEWRRGVTPEQKVVDGKTTELNLVVPASVFD